MSFTANYSKKFVWNSENIASLGLSIQRNDMILHGLAKFQSLTCTTLENICGI